MGFFNWAFTTLEYIFFAVVVVVGVFAILGILSLVGTMLVHLV